jgi:3',5'-cyclic AMP phosphodiesterase CpdA
VKLLLTSDLHLVPQWREGVLLRLREWIGAYRPEGLVIAGDLAVAPEAHDAFRCLRDIFPNGPIAITLGNHDFWSEPGRGYRSLSEVIERCWVPAAGAFVIHLLDLENLHLNGITLVGAYGHYDLGFRYPNLRYDGAVVTTEHYLMGQPPIPTRLRWRDFSRMPRDLDLASVAREQVRALEAKLRMVTGKHAFVVLHTPPFAALLGIPDISTVNPEAPSVYAFFRAYLGNEQMGKLLQREKERIIGVVCGHTHRTVTPTDLEGFFGLNIGSDYGEPAAYLFETKTSRLTRISGANELSVTAPEKGVLSA